MTELEPVYNSEIECPVCGKSTIITKVRSKFVKLVSQDEDFCPHYQTINPVFYEAWVCSQCGYAAHSSVFPDISIHDQKCVLQIITPKWTCRSFCGERDVHQALDAFKIVLYNLMVREASSYEFGKVCLRIAWLYRYMEQEDEECRFLKFAHDYYKKAFTSEHTPGDKLDQYSCMYIVGELARRLKNYEEAISWFGRLISASAKPQERTKIQPRLLENTREMVRLTKEAMGKQDSI